MFYVAEFPTFEHDQVVGLHQHILNGKVRGIYVYLEGEGEVGEL